MKSSASTYMEGLAEGLDRWQENHDKFMAKIKKVPEAPKHRIQPTLDRVLVRRHEAPDSVILLTDAKKHAICKVLAVGPGAWRDGVFCKTAVKPGDNVLIPGYGGQNPDHEFPDGSFLIQEGDIGAIVG